MIKVHAVNAGKGLQVRIRAGKFYVMPGAH